MTSLPEMSHDPVVHVSQFLIVAISLLSQRENLEGVSQPPSDDVIRELSRSLREALGVSLFGIDVIINNQTGQHAVIDINAFPGRCQCVSVICALAPSRNLCSDLVLRCHSVCGDKATPLSVMQPSIIREMPVFCRSDPFPQVSGSG